MIGAWAQLERGKLLPDEFAEQFTDIIRTMTGTSVNVTDLLFRMHNALVTPHPEVLTAIQCIRAQGIKSALITNNWWLEKGKTFRPVDVEYFDVVSNVHPFTTTVEPWLMQLLILWTDY